MAHTIPETVKPRATAGERLLFQTLKKYLPEDYLVYYEPDIRGRRPDFVIIGPDLGLVVLEVKDYTKNTLYQMNPDRWTLKTSSGELQTVPSPLKQAREYAFQIADLLKRDVQLIRDGGTHRLQLKFPYGFGTVFTRMTRENLVNEGVYHVLEPGMVLSREEIDPENNRFSAILLKEKLSRMFPVAFSLKERLSDLDIQHIRFHLFPEVRVHAKVKAPYQDRILLSLDDIEVMDLHQENLAKQIGDKHRLIRGVAGSGKTLILASRAALLAKEHPDWNILILCFNISLSRSIRRMIRDKFRQAETLVAPGTDGKDGDREAFRDGRVQVRYFHEWLRDDLGVRNDRQIPELIEKLDRSEIRLPVYDAILIDEGQDFESEWLKLTSRLLNPETQSLLIVEDRAQNIYRRKRSFRQDTGLDFRGRSRILRINYRNTEPIVRFSWDFYQAHTSEKGKVSSDSTDEIEIIPPQSTRRKGPAPVVRRFSDLREEAAFVAREIGRLRKTQRVPLSEIMILYRVKHFGGENLIGVLQDLLDRRGIPSVWIAANQETKRNFNPGEAAVKISTIDSSKGLDVRAVFIVKADRMPLPVVEDAEKEAALLYIAMTRAKEYLYVTYSGESAFTRYFDRFAGENPADFQSVSATDVAQPPN